MMVPQLVLARYFVRVPALHVRIPGFERLQPCELVWDLHCVVGDIHRLRLLGSLHIHIDSEDWALLSSHIQSRYLIDHLQMRLLLSTTACHCSLGQLLFPIHQQRYLMQRADHCTTYACSWILCSVYCLITGQKIVPFGCHCFF